jgi:hypothetical protein
VPVSAIDSCEPQVIRAFEKDGWEILEKPRVIRGDTTNVLADMSLRRVLGELVQEIIILEVKCFSDPKADLQEVYTAIGQYQVYRTGLLNNNEDLPLYLAVPLTAYRRFQNESMIASALRSMLIKIVVVDIEEENVELWIN